MGDVVARIRAQIAADGPITFARYMELALYGEDGYYAVPPVGTHGDFVTSPHIHPVFGELLASGLTQMAVTLGAPSPLRVTEAGAGDGTLAAQLVPALTETVGEVVYTGVERSPGARDALEAAGFTPTGELPADIGDLLVANELLDNVPFRVVREGREVRIGLEEDGRLVEVLAPLDAELEPWRDRTDGIVPLDAIAFVEAVGAALAARRGFAVLIDYGSAGQAGGPLHGYAGHHIVEDVLAAPGQTDITAGVDMALMAAMAEASGARAFPVITQRAALTALGFEAWYHEQLAAQHRQLDDRDGLAAVRTWSGKGRALMLVDPAGLGRFRWLVLGSPGLDAPEWLTAAIRAEGLG